MALPTIEELRLQCRIDETQDDALLLTYLTVAIEKAENYLNRKLYDERVPDDDPDGMLITPLIKLALMLAVGFWYEHREPNVLASGFKELLNDYRIRPVGGQHAGGTAS
ncbi:head-tail connector protein [Xenorhabdus bovienii]|uniref:head-tail connector protein n=1 Tax=Xenorhabdus bovienii TaxID=40576 RepID=UPI00237D16BA|nr:head-tail connector protein [Xenorhabdus bovienii]MDE1484594.1 head-tail connector protein [Xenorhabdus bovienii]MDE9443773.1 head-tail connector protein [Xenorhabdus bovienii]